MWGFGGKYYWVRKERERRVDGIVVIFAWMSSEEKHVKNYVDLYYSLGWISLVCHSQFLNSFFPDKATLLALDVLNELVEELKVRPCPVVFASFSGGPKACLYKVLQIIDGQCEGRKNPEDYRLVRDCTAGYIYDSSPVDFTSDLGTRFVLHPSILGMSQPPRLAVWIANGIASGLDALFLSRFESQRAEYWQTLYSSVSMGAPYLILFSEDDDLAPYQTICNFAKRLQELGADVRLVKWDSSPHVGHYRQHQDEYTSAVSGLLESAAAIYSQRIQQLERENAGLGRGCDVILLPPQRKASSSACSSDGGLRGLSVDLGDPFLVAGPGSLECHQHQDGAVGGGSGSGSGSVHGSVVHLPSPPRINASHGVLGQILFDVCVPTNVEGWDITPPSSSKRLPFPPPPTKRQVHFNPIRCMQRRSRM
ncbi:hypothetical protein Dimus_002364 [Dionaea muscipula]